MTMPFATDVPAAVGAIEAALARKDATLLALAQSNVLAAAPGPGDLCRVGTLAKVTLIDRTEELTQVLLEGVERAEIVLFDEEAAPLQASALPRPFPPDPGVESEALSREILALTRRYFALSHPEVRVSFPERLGEGDDILQLAFPLTHLVAHDHRKAQQVLEAPTRLAAMRLLRAMLDTEIQVLELRHKISEDAEEKIKREQHDYILHQQMQAIQKELGEQGPAEQELAEIRAALAQTRLPDEVRRETEREIARLERTAPSSPDYHIALGHLQLIRDLPWDRTTTDCLELANAQGVLDEDHFGLEEVKERIIEHLAVMKLNPEARAPILCFVGPPGVGKTSLGQSIARAMGRKFEHFSLGGLHDEAELRGHRRTYIGAMPGRIIQAVRRAGARNPLVMLDEVDKLGHDFRGDPAAALMEILDPAQNGAFRDNYLDLPFDLARVFFITTANSVDGIPRPLQDRMETVRLSGYCEEEKLEIARRYLLPRRRREAGLAAEDLVVPDATILAVVRRYTREAGVRELERMLGRLARKAAVRFAGGNRTPLEVHEGALGELLGPERFLREQARQELPPGVAVGLAWTEAGGEVLYVEAVELDDGEKIVLTGQMGEVMKESAMAAKGYVVSHCEILGLSRPKKNLHIHVPAGAIPKDGPSAGITVAVALASLFTGRPARSDTAMTGEITLSGLVLPVGGVKEKVLAARRAGIRRVVLPRDNEQDLAKLPGQVAQEMEFFFVERVREVLPLAIPGFTAP
jgi:ATP-dependent Lon protease